MKKNRFRRKLVLATVLIISVVSMSVYTSSSCYAMDNTESVNIMENQTMGAGLFCTDGNNEIVSDETNCVYLNECFYEKELWQQYINYLIDYWDYIRQMFASNGIFIPLCPEPTAESTVKPTVAPTVKPTVAPTVKPTVAPTVKPTVAPTVAPTVKPTAAPTVKPTVAPTVNPSIELNGDSKLDFQLSSAQASIIQDVKDGVDELRQSLGKSELEQSTTLTNVAIARAKHMADNNYFSHNYNGSKNYVEFAKKYNYKGTSIGENIFYCSGYPLLEVADLAMKSLIASQGHYENMIKDKWTTIGVGAYYGNNRWYVVQIFGNK